MFAITGSTAEIQEVQNLKQYFQGSPSIHLWIICLHVRIKINTEHKEWIYIHYVLYLQRWMNTRSMPLCGTSILPKSMPGLWLPVYCREVWLLIYWLRKLKKFADTLILNKKVITFCKIQIKKNKFLTFVLTVKLWKSKWPAHETFLSSIPFAASLC